MASRPPWQSCLSIFKLMTSRCFSCFFFNDTATTEIYTLSLHDALPISSQAVIAGSAGVFHWTPEGRKLFDFSSGVLVARSEEHTSELQSHSDLVCRLLLEKKKHRVHVLYAQHCNGRTQLVHPVYARHRA